MDERDKKVIIKITKVLPERLEFRCVFEDSEYHIDDMPNCSLDLLNYHDVDDMNKILQEIGRAAWMLAARQEAAEKLKKSPLSKLDLASLIGEEIPLSVGEIYE